MQRLRCISNFLLAAMTAALLVGCNDSDSATTDEPELIYDVIIESPVPSTDLGTLSPTTLITASVFLPRDYPFGGPYPLIIHSHGWAGSRVSPDEVLLLEGGGADSDTSYFSLVDAQVAVLREAGYAVVSYDQRGFGRGDDGDEGTSDGTHGMSPDHEIEDAKAVMDWAVNNLHLLRDAPGDPRVGLIGSSYGGAYQLMLAAEDDRVDAIVPSATWFDLADALAPNRVLKKGWLIGICETAIVHDNADVSVEIEQACSEASERSNRELSDTPLAENIFFNNGLSAYTNQANFSMPAVDALILQGNRDILFNMNEAAAIYDLLTQAGGDVSLLLHESGHSIRRLRDGPGSQGPLGNGYCGRIDTILTIRKWLDWKLRGGPSIDLPNICVPLDNQRAIHVNSLVTTGAQSQVVFGPVAIGALHNNVYSPANQAVFIPLSDEIADDKHVLAGIPVAHLSVTSGPANIDPTPLLSGPNTSGVFIGIGIQRDRERFLVDDQVQPVLSSDARADMTQAIPLVGVAEKLEAGDRVGILLYGKFDQFENHMPGDNHNGTNWEHNNSVVSGTVTLPIIVPDKIDTRSF